MRIQGRILGLIVLLALIALVVPSTIHATPLLQEYQGAVAYPTPNAVLRGQVAVMGTANHAEFWKYEVWAAPGVNPQLPDEQWFRLMVGEAPIVGGQLALWDTAAMPDGTYTLRLRVVRLDGNWQDFDVAPLVVANTTPPTPMPTVPPPPTETPTTVAQPPAIPPGTPGTDKVIHLTFDDGPDPTWTPEVLRVLARYNARATFFAVGRYAEVYPQLIQAAVAAGHTVGNHTYSHWSLVGLSREQFSREVLRAEEALGGYGVKCLRPPYGHTDANTRAYAAELGYSVVMWTIDPYDWQQPGASVIASRVVSRAYPGAVVLFHDGGGNRAQTVAALESVLFQLSQQGYRFEPVCR
jgi:peptidoglycan/xylan/chitin deacetylase (PgdA/CDA1 family)